MRPMMASEASPSLGNSLEMMCSREGSLPVHWTRYFRLTVREFSPEIERRRSTTTLPFFPMNRASLMMARDLPINGASPKSPPRLFSVGPATFWVPTSAVRMRKMTWWRCRQAQTR